MTATLRYKISMFSVLIATFMAAGATAGEKEKIAALTFDREANTLFLARTHELYRSNDEGRGWTKIPLPPSVRGDAIAAVAASAKRKDVLYLAGSGFGVLRSADGGRHWATRNTGLPGSDVVALAVHADQPDTVYVHVSGKGIFSSQDAGVSWKWMDGGPSEGIGQLIHSNMPGSMQTGWLFAATPKGVRRSMDCFCLWQDAGELGAPVDAVSYDPREPRHIYAATTKGLFLSVDGGEQWTRMSAPASRITALVISSSGIVFAGTADGGLYRSTDEAKSWERRMHSALLGDAIGLFATVTAARAGDVAPAAINSEFAVSGRAIYQQHCAVCHGARGEGAPAWRNRDALGELPAPPHDPQGHTWRHSDAMLSRMILQGWRDPFNRTERLTMPAFAGTLTPQEIRSVIAYFKTLWTPEQRKFQREESQRQSLSPTAR